MSIHQFLEERASHYKPGQSGLIALDWWNGNRSVLVDANLSGLIVGFSLATKPEEIYRALMESTAFGTRKIIESYSEAGVEVNEIFACGGLPQRNKLLMQIYADITNREIKIADSNQTTALGAAMYAAVAAGRMNGGYESIFEAAERMAKVKEETYVPIPENVRIYNELYKYYLELHDYFGREKYPIMHNLKKLRTIGSE
jgi:L-ribulokinase